MNIEITNDFIEYLLKTMISGLGIPPEFLSYSEQTEFARSLGMMNGKFVRSIIVYQKLYAEQFTELFRKLYANEYNNDDFNESKEEKKKDVKASKSSKNKTTKDLVDSDNERKIVSDQEIDNKEVEFNINLLEVRFPSPQSLNMTALQEQVNNSKEIIEFISDTMVDNEDDKLKESYKQAVTKDILSNFDWNKYEKILENVKIENAESKLTSTEDDNGGSSF
jgi:hypothetical protein